MEEDNNVVVVTNVYGDFCVRKARKRRQKLLVQELLLDYANNTTLHGLPYITKKNVTMIEKIFWLLTFIISTAWCIYLISNVWYKWRTSPVLVTVSEQLMPVGKVPFPSVTICPQSKSVVSKYNFTANKIKYDLLPVEATSNLTWDDDFNKYLDTSLLCGNYFERNLYSIIYNDKSYTTNGSDSSVYKHIFDVAPDYEDVFAYCTLRGRARICSNLFNKVITNEGICYTMNSLAPNDTFHTNNLQEDYPYTNAITPIQGWSMKAGYTNLKDLSRRATTDFYYPIPGTENAASPDLEVILQDNNYDRDQLCNGLNTGYKVFIQHPADFPQSSLYYYAVLNNQVSSMALSFIALSTSDSLEGYGAEVRQCYFPHERQLKYFRIYTASNCRIECLSDFTHKTCGCVEFYMPHNSRQSVCTMRHESCIRNALAKLTNIESSKDTAKCRCLPSCNSVDYTAEILKTDFHLKQLQESYGATVNKTIHEKGKQYSKLEIYYKRPSFISMRRSELFGVTDFLANCGGLLGLFLGFSFLSLVEIIYFLTLRLGLTLKKDLEEEKAQAKKDKEVTTEKF